MHGFTAQFLTVLPHLEPPLGHAQSLAQVSRGEVAGFRPYSVAVPTYPSEAHRVPHTFMVERQGV